MSCLSCGLWTQPDSGVDCNKNHSPVIHDVTCCILLALQMILDLEWQIVDVETAFLHGNLEEEICMDCPEDSEGGSPTKCLKLLEGLICELGQGSRTFFMKLILKLKDIGFCQCNADPCLMSLGSECGPMFAAIHVDD